MSAERFASVLVATGLEMLYCDIERRLGDPR
jgi:hypothetical protein